MHNEHPPSIDQLVSAFLTDHGLESYIDIADQLTTMLTARERVISSALLGQADAYNLDMDDVKEILIGLNMSVPENVGSTPPHEQEDQGRLQQVEQNLTELATQVQALTEFATRHGFRVGG